MCLCLGTPFLWYKCFLQVVAIDWHGHAPCAASATRQFGAFDGDDVFFVIGKVDFVCQDVFCREDVKAGLVHGFHGVGVAGVAEHLAGSHSKEVRTAVPLLAFLVPVVCTAAEYRFKVHAQFFEGTEQVFLRADALQFPVLYFDVDGLVIARIQDERGIYHAFVPVKEGEYHVEVNE